MGFDYDIAILGCGEAGIFAAYNLTHPHPELKLVALDQGQNIYRHACPIVADNTLPSLYAAGDGAGVTRGLAQTGASGVQTARAVYRRLEQ